MFIIPGSSKEACSFACLLAKPNVDNLRLTARAILLTRGKSSETETGRIARSALARLKRGQFFVRVDSFGL